MDFSLEEQRHMKRSTFIERIFVWSSFAIAILCNDNDESEEMKRF